MDVVIPLGPHSKWKFNEVRYALRSIEKHSIEGFNNVYLIGERPGFFNYGSGGKNQVFHIDYKPDPREAKELRIWRKVIRACQEENISDDFFFMNDDYFFLKDFNISNFPYFHKGNLRNFYFAKQTDIKSGYDRKAKRTLEVLDKLNLSTWHYDIHCPNIVNKKKFLDCFQELRGFIELEARKPNGSLLINTTYLNWAAVSPLEAKDVKVESIKKLPTETPLVFSIYDKAVDQDFKEFLLETYPKKLPFEQEVKQVIKNESKVFIRFSNRFVDGGQQFGPGRWKLPREQALRLSEQGKGELEIPIEREPEPEVKEKTPLAPKQDTPLPEDFPSYDNLIEHGYTTIQSLQKPNIEEELLEVKGLGHATIVKIGLRLNNYESF